MSGRSWVLIASLSLSLAAGAALAAAPARPSARPSIEPTEAQLPPVDPAWHAQGWRPVTPHAFVLKKLLPVRTEPKPSAPAAFWLKGGTRVPVLEQGTEWWRISWTDGRTGWARAADLEAHASFVLIDAKTGKLIRRMAAKGQWGAVSDGDALWSIANTGITRTILGERPVFWAKPVAADRDADFPRIGVWNADRTAFIVRSKHGMEGALLHTEIATGKVRDLGTVAVGELHGITQGDRVLLVGSARDGDETRLYDPGLKRITRRVPAVAVAVTRTGVSFLERDDELIRCGTDLRATARVRLPAEIEGVCLSVDQRYVAVSYGELRTKEDRVISRVRIFHAENLKPVVTLKLSPESGAVYLRQMGSWAGGWWLLASGEGMEQFTRFRRNGERLEHHDTYGQTAVSPDGGTAYAAEGDHLTAIDTATGKARRFPYSWRRNLPAQFLPPPSDSEVVTHLDVSSLTVSPDGKMLVLTEWLNGDPEG